MIILSLIAGLLIFIPWIVFYKDESGEKKMNHMQDFKNKFNDSYFKDPQTITEVVLLARHTNGEVLHVTIGDAYTLNGMLDVAKREMFLSIYERNLKQKRES